MFEIKGKNPDGGEWIFSIAEVHLQKLVDRGLAYLYYQALLIPGVLEQPDAIFRGLKRDDYQEALCYVGRPERQYRDHTITMPAPPGMVFLVFATKGRRIFGWRWELADAHNPKLPDGYKNRFETQLWPKL